MMSVLVQMVELYTREVCELVCHIYIEYSYVHPGEVIGKSHNYEPILYSRKISKVEIFEVEQILLQGSHIS